MFKKICFLFLISLFCMNFCFADNLNYSEQEKKFIEYQANHAINKIKVYRSALYKSLDVTPPQIIDIKKIDKEFYAQIKPIFIEDFYTMNRLSRLTSKPKPSKGLVNVEKKKIKANSKILDNYKNEYEANLYKILTPEQKSKYLKLKKDRIKEYKASLR